MAENSIIMSIDNECDVLASIVSLICEKIEEMIQHMDALLFDMEENQEEDLPKRSSAFGKRRNSIHRKNRCIYRSLSSRCEFPVALKYLWSRLFLDNQSDIRIRAVGNFDHGLLCL